MADRITVTGVVGTQPTTVRTEAGLLVARFRLASNSYRRGSDGEWVELPTNWYSTSAFGRLASNVAGSVRTGDAVVVSGRVEVRDWERDGRRGTSVDIVADTVGHDLNHGRSTFQRPFRAADGVETAGGDGVPAGGGPVDGAVPAGDGTPVAGRADGAGSGPAVDAFAGATAPAGGDRDPGDDDAPF